MQFAAYRLHEWAFESNDFMRGGFLFHDSLIEHVAFPVAVHAVMHNLFLQEQIVTIIFYISGTG